MGEVVAPARTEMDLANAASVREMIRAVRPRWIVNPGAYTAVDKAESEPELALRQRRGRRVMGRGGAGARCRGDSLFDGLCLRWAGSAAVRGDGCDRRR